MICKMYYISISLILLGGLYITLTIVDLLVSPLFNLTLNYKSNSQFGVANNRRVCASRTRQLTYSIGEENITITTSGSTNYIAIPKPNPKPNQLH